MKQEQQQQAETLYFQTDLTNTQIADTLGVSRRTMYNWVHENNWEQLKKASAAMPSLIAGNCYQAMARLTEHVLSPERADKPITRDEVNSLYKLTLTVNKLKAKGIVSEIVETLTWFLDSVREESPEMAEKMMPFVRNFVSSRSLADLGYSMPPKAKGKTAQEAREAQLDLEDMEAWAAEMADAKARDNATATTSPTTPAPHPPFNTWASAPPVLESLIHAQPLRTPEQKPKVDLRKELRGTATKGPGRAFRQKQAAAKAAA